MFSMTSLESFHCLSQHLLEILSLAENSKIFLVGNKCDLPREVTDSDIDQFLEQFPKFDGVFKISCKTNHGVQDMFNVIADKLATVSHYKAPFVDTFKLHSFEDSCDTQEPTEGRDYCCAK